MTSYLVYRHGSNATNQSMTAVTAVAIIDAETETEARKIAAQNLICYANQFFSFVDESELTEQGKEDWNEIIAAALQIFGLSEKIRLSFLPKPCSITAARQSPAT